MRKIVVVLSGGLDSTTLLYRAIKEFDKVYAITFNYGQKHSKEIEYAETTCKNLNINHKVIDLTCIKELINKSSLTSDVEIPEGHYANENMKSTVVPNRNMIMASIAIAYAINIEADYIALGVHSGDHTIYPDCRPEFIEALKNIAKICDYRQIDIFTPYLKSDKIEIVKDGLELGVDYSLTWTCYKGLDRPCRKCGSCVEREEAFEKNGIIDPLLCD